MAIKVNQYQFDRICSQMEKEFGKIRKGEEEGHVIMIYPMERNLLKTYRNNPSSNSRRLKEAIPIVLFKVKGYLSGEEYDVSHFESEENSKLAHAILMAFDPFTNAEIKNSMKDAPIDFSNADDLKLLYSEPVTSLLWIKESVDAWEKKLGPNGYFEFLEGHLGEAIPHDDKIDFTVLLPEEDGEES